jgi:hypothetical protein
MNLGNYQKTPVGASLNRISQQVAATAIQQFGKALPCSVMAVKGQVVKVKFEISSTFTLPTVTIPIATSIYDWIPVQVGDKGMTVPADVYLGGVSGLGNGVATLTPRANLSSLLFVPVANAAWTTTNPSQRVVQGPQGVLVQTMDGTATINVTKTGITLSFGGHTLAVTSAGVLIDGNIYENHVHQYMPGTGTPTDTGPPLM